MLQTLGDSQHEAELLDGERSRRYQQSTLDLTPAATQTHADLFPDRSEVGVGQVGGAQTTRKRRGQRRQIELAPDPPVRQSRVQPDSIGRFRAGVDPVAVGLEDGPPGARLEVVERWLASGHEAEIVQLERQESTHSAGFS